MDVDGLANLLRLNRRTAKAPDFSLRPGRINDYPFAERLCFETTRQLLLARGNWDRTRETQRLLRAFDPSLVHIIVAGGLDIGWIQVAASETNLHLSQLHLSDPYRSRGIGSNLLGSLIRRARDTDRRVSLSVLRNNRAVNLYLRLGFLTVGFDRDKRHMQHAHGGATDLLQHPALMKDIPAKP